MLLRTYYFATLLLALVAAVGPARAAPVPGDRLPVMKLASASGGTRPAWHRGGITIVAFCAFWCDTWKQQSRRMTTARAALNGLPITWTMISVDGRWADKSREKEWGDIARGALLDSGGRWTNELGVHSVPTTLVVDGSGRVLYAGQGIARSQTLLKVVRGALDGEAPNGGEAGLAPVHLVFDDFPSRDSRLDDRLLDILRAAKVRVTFCGNAARRRNSLAIARRAIAEGHGMRAAFGTPPRGIIDPFDWKRPGGDELRRRVLCAAAPGKIVLLHAGVRDTVDALPGILRSLRNRRLTFAALRKTARPRG